MKNTCVVAGATGYIGKSVVREAVRQGYKTVALVRDPKKIPSNEFFQGCQVVECDVCNPTQLQQVSLTGKLE